MSKVTKHFVKFYSPGTFVAEQSTQPITSWNVKKACEMAHGVVERYGATPYAFRFITRSRGKNDLDSKIVDHSPLYYLGGKIETLEEIKARNDPNDRILISNMEGNGWSKVITNDNSWRTTQPFVDGDDILLDWKPKPRKRK